MENLTRREKHALIICVFIAFVFIIFKPDQNTAEVIDYFGLLFIVSPLALYIASDPERRKVGK